MDIEPIGNAVKLEDFGNQLEIALIDVRTISYFLSTLQTSSEHREVGTIDNY